MKQLKHWLLALLIIPTLALTFTACGGDDDDDEPSSSNSLVGYWLGHSSEVYYAFYFAADGTGWDCEYHPPYAPYAYTITWKQSGNSLSVTTSDGYCEIYTITFVDGDTIVLKADNSNYTYTRVSKSELPFSISDIEWDD